MSQGVGFQAFNSAAKVLIYSGYVQFHLACNFAERFTLEVHAEDAAGTLMITLAGLRMTVIVVELFVQTFLVFVAALLIEPIDVLFNIFDILRLVGDVEGGELGIVAGDDVELVLTLALVQFLVALDEETGEVPDGVVLGVHTYFETGVLEKILVEDVPVEQGSLDFGLVGDVELG